MIGSISYFPGRLRTGWINVVPNCIPHLGGSGSLNCPEITNVTPERTIGPAA